VPRPIFIFGISWNTILKYNEKTVCRRYSVFRNRQCLELAVFLCQNTGSDRPISGVKPLGCTARVSIKGQLISPSNDFLRASLSQYD
jgi:hypothetical protein